MTGVSGEIDVTVRGADVATPATVRWMIGYENQLLSHYGYRRGEGLRPRDPVSRPVAAGSVLHRQPDRGRPPNLTQSQINGLLVGGAAYFSQAVITPDHREATLAFGIRLMPLSRQQRVIDYMRSRLHPPPGVQRRPRRPAGAGGAGQRVAVLDFGHRFLTLIAGLLAVGLVLLLVLRKPQRALVPMTPIVLATGWSSLILFVIGIPLNPMSATLGTLVIAISTEFSVLLSERYRQERAAGHDLRDALARTYRSTGAAVLASGVTAIVGFGVLVFSNITMLRDFGFVTLIDLSVSLAGVLLVLPAVLAPVRARRCAAAPAGRAARPASFARVASGVDRGSRERTRGLPETRLSRCRHSSGWIPTAPPARRGPIRPRRYHRRRRRTRPGNRRRRSIPGATAG